MTTKAITNVVQGDCKTSGLCSGFNNTGLPLNCFEASKNEFDKARQAQVKIDSSVVIGSKVVDWSKAEKDVVIAEELVRVETENLKKQKLINKLKMLGLIDEEIDLLIK